MPNPIVQSFFETLEASNLLAPEQLAAARSELQDDGDEAEQVAKRLVSQQRLTAWQSQQLLAGHTAFFLGKYKLLEPIGQGGMGTVFKAEQAPLGRVVAIKVMARKLLKDANAVARFRREIQLAAALNHPNIVAALDAESVGDVHFLVMEYVEGNDLATIAKRQKTLPVGSACEFIRQAAVGLQHAHERGLVHRDIKPSNLFLAISHQPSAISHQRSAIKRILHLQNNPQSAIRIPQS